MLQITVKARNVDAVDATRHYYSCGSYDRCHYRIFIITDNIRTFHGSALLETGCIHPFSCHSDHECNAIMSNISPVKCRSPSEDSQSCNTGQPVGTQRATVIWKQSLPGYVNVYSQTSIVESDIFFTAVKILRIPSDLEIRETEVNTSEQYPNSDFDKISPINAFQSIKFVLLQGIPWWSSG
ncbi:hypothetical protein MJG53_011567 [Ovis ammon polii x Ovis aries]|uniref:Uncharacterized protein n=1 Tax=Ovis ammon polii x Ovis aries TaxID=2918886 RepID=A0ACB9UPP3_9CETA|nr:hypothetical protein MJG53_011567 [Ovis ammon polii x Ovis aries]